MKPIRVVKNLNTVGPARIFNQILLISLILFLPGCSPKAKTPPDSSQKTLSIMTYNVENLFDHLDDPNKKDETFLPMAAKKNKRHQQGCKSIKVRKWRNQCLHWDWSLDAIETKLERLAKVIRSVNHGRGPDILFLQEVENLGILERLRKEKLSGLGYEKSILVEGSDIRGIDVAILSRFPVIGSPQIIPIAFHKNTEKRRLRDTRGLLHATIDVQGENVELYSVHFPAPFHPSSMRQSAFKTLNEQLNKNPSSHLVLAGGDFNLTSKEDLREKTLDRVVAPHWEISQRHGCSNCRGTNYYAPKKNWSFLDMILVNKKGLKKHQWKINPNKTRVVNSFPFQSRKGHPFGFKMPGQKGLSDHWPVLIQLERI